MIIAIVGPTGVGKTKLSLELAKKIDGEIINADSTQIFLEANIGTAKVSKEAQGRIIHHLFDIKKLDESYSVFEYQKDARIILEDILKRNKTAIVVGGSNMYLSALLYDYKFSSETKADNMENLSCEEMYEALMKKDLKLNIEKNNKQRLQRYYMKYVCNDQNVESSGNKLLYPVMMIGLTTDRSLLYERINTRVDTMMENGLLEEVRFLYKKYPNSKQLCKMIGYKELMEYFNGLSLEDAVEKIKKNSRHYAKRQYTWMNNKMNVKWFETDFENFQNTIDEVVEYIKK